MTFSFQQKSLAEVDTGGEGGGREGGWGGGGGGGGGVRE